jgi:amino acid transporter
LVRGFLNIFGAPWLAVIEGIFAILHFIVFIPFIVAMWSLSPTKQSATDALLKLEDNGTGWNSPGLAVLIGQVTAMYTLVGSDAAAHMSEEIQEASIVVPRSMWWSFTANIPPTIIVLITYCFCIGNTVAALDSPTGFPIIYIFSTITSSPAGATGLTFVLLVLLFIITVSAQAVTSRQTFAFARDNGLPLAFFIGAVHPKYKVPVNSIIVSVLFTVLLSVINIGSTAAFDAFIGVSVVALMATYSISIFCVLLKRLRGEPLVAARWRVFGRNVAEREGGGGLGKCGVLVNSMALTYSLWSFFWGFWPAVKDVQPATMNWAVLIFTGIMIFAALAYILHARKVYNGPVTNVVVLEEESTEKLYRTN